MNNNSWFKKEMPLQTVIGFGGGATGFSAHSSAASKTYRDDVFSTYLYKGNADAQYTAHQIVNGIDNSKHGGLVWIKNRTYAQHNTLLDTERVNGSGQTAELYSDTNSAQAGPYAGYNITAFNNNGFKLEGNGTGTNRDVDDYVAWNFRKATGFFDIVKYTGNGSNRTISHSLGSVPGCVIVKRLEDSANWAVYHRGCQETGAQLIQLNDSGGSFTATDIWNDTAPTSTSFTVGTSANTNGNGETYIAYIFAGGESEAATARSVDFDGSSDRLTLASSSDFGFGTGDFTVEFWAKYDSIASPPVLLDTGDFGGSNKWVLAVNGSGNIFYRADGGDRIESSAVPIGQWRHYALVRNSSTTTLYIDGNSEGTWSDSTNYSSVPLTIGAKNDGSTNIDGKMSNIRIVKGTAIYTSAFRPPTEPLTDITNTKLLCCQSTGVATATVTPGTITPEGDPEPSTDSPFDDPEGYVFGEDEDQNLIKCGVFTGNGSTAGPHIQVGWEPDFILFKANSKSDPWYIADTTRRITNDGGTYNPGVDNTLLPSSNQAENVGNWNLLDISSTGWKPTTADSKINGSGHTYIYIAIRRPDGYVGKPPSAGTGVFAMDIGNDSSTIPAFDSNFIVDYAWYRKPGVTFDWTANTRLTGGKELQPNTSAAESSGDADLIFDSNAGYAKNRNNTYKAWMWKRHAGMDVVNWNGDDVAGRQIRHSLNTTPEMIWAKCRSSAEDWAVYHKGVNGGTNPWDYYLSLDGDGAQVDETNRWNDTAPTSTHFVVGDGGAINDTGQDYIAMLFASANDADGNPISKVGSYSGSGSGQTITTGFQPRFVIIKCSSHGGRNWLLFDTLAGWSAGSNDFELNINTDSAGWSAYDFGGPTATGFTITTINNDINGSGFNYIYYAHA